MIQVENISKSYGTTRAVRSVSFTIDKGEIVGFLGPNGAGKTTTMKILTCYIPADQGRATVAGYDVFEDSLEVRRRVGYLPESAPLYHEMPVIDFLKFVGQMRGIKGARLRSRLLDVVGVTSLKDATGKYIGELSKGFRQRVALAQALLHEPDVLVLDEPTSGLDPNQQREIRDVIRQIGKEKTVILSTHILPEVTATCDRAIIINDGEVVASGTPEALMSSSGGSQTVVARIRGPQTDVERKLGQLANVTDVRAEDAGNGWVRYEVRTGKDGDVLGEKLFDLAVQSHWKISELRTEGATLEDVFAELTR
jgi:ABC-2 type transport system ATP-binding protein